MTPLVIVPARVGSKGVPNKNFKPLPDGSTLIDRACDIGGHFGRVLVTTDAEFTHWGRSDVLVHRRPARLAADDAPMSAVIVDALRAVGGNYWRDDQPIMLLQPTTPFRTVERLQACLDALELLTTAVVTVFNCGYSPERMFYVEGRPVTKRWVTNRQASRGGYVPDGYCYVLKVREAMDPLDWFSHRVHLDIGPRPVNIDTESDWEEACRIVRAQMEAGQKTVPSGLSQP